MTVLRGVYVFVAIGLLVPWMMMCTFVHFLYACRVSKRELGKCMPIRILKAYGEGCKQGMYMIKGYVKTGEVKYVY